MSREPSISLKAGQGAVYYIGDSFTYGQGVEIEESWPAQLRLRMTENGAGSVPLLGYAKPGMSSSYSLYMLARAISSGAPRLVIVMMGWNANDNDFAEQRQRDSKELSLATRAHLLLEHLRLYRFLRLALLRRSETIELADVKLVPFVPRYTLYNFRDYQRITLRNLTKTARLARRYDVPIVFLNYPHQDLPPNPYSPIEYIHVLFSKTKITDADYIIEDRRPGEIAVNSIIRHVGAAEGVPVIDIASAFDALQDKSNLFQDDWHHPTARGQRIIADKLFSTLKPLLLKQLPSRQDGSGTSRSGPAPPPLCNPTAPRTEEPGAQHRCVNDPSVDVQLRRCRPGAAPLS